MSAGHDGGDTDQPITVRALSFDDPNLPGVWARLLEASDTQLISQSFEWQRVWHETLLRGDLLLLAADRDGSTVAIAPFYTEAGMVYFLGVGEADSHDVLGDGHDPDILAALLRDAMSRVPEFLGFELHFIPEYSRTGPALAHAAQQLGLNLFEMGSIDAVRVDIASNPTAVRQAVSRSMRKAENYFRQRGELVVQQLTTAAEVLPLLPEFFTMHIARWQLKGIESDFVNPKVRRFLERWVEVSADCGWLRFIRLEWQGATLGMDMNWHYRSAQFSGRWVFALEHAKQSPGQVLLRQSTLLALDAGMHTYDLGLGDQAYKFRLPSERITCFTWGLYPP
jgi:CelD/BcsL family acetyltransferase involved in cellulose biosynthesis